MTASSESIIGNIVLSGQGAFGEDTASVGGSFAVNTIVNQTESTIRGSTVRAVTAGIDLSATDRSIAVAGAGALQVAGTAAVGAAVAVNTIVSSTAATIVNSTLEATQEIKLDAHNVSIIASVAVGAQVATEDDESGADPSRERSRASQCLRLRICP